MLKQLITYFGLAYLISWVIWLPLWGGAIGIHNLPYIPYNHAIGGLGPLLASFITTYIFQKREGVKKLVGRCLQATPIAYLLVALLSPFLLWFMSSLIAFFVNGAPISPQGVLNVKEFPAFGFIHFLLYNLFFFGLGEETGWRGFALPRLQSRTNAFWASIILTVLWAVWHWPLFLYRPGYTGMDIGGILGWVFSLLTGSILLTWLFNSTKGSLFICAVFHATIDIAFTADVADKNIVGYMGALITFWGIITVIVFGVKNLSKINRVKD